MGNTIRIPWAEWEIVKVIGRGGFGTVYEIQKDVFGRKESAALKVLTIPESREELDELYSQGYDEESISEHYKGYLHDIVGEYSIMLDLKGHPNIVYCDEVKYVQHDDGIGWDVFIKMELLKPLSKAVPAEYSEEEVLRLGKDLCAALVYCGQQKIIHRDIKPQNIFVSKSGTYKLGDFGIAKVSDKTMSGTKIGTYEYMAPEVYRAQHYGPRVDIYSLGLVMYWMMNQRCTPFLPYPPQIPTSGEKEEARNRRLQGERLPPPVNGSEWLKSIVLKACAFDPADRYACAEDMLDALQDTKRVAPLQTSVPVDLDVRMEMSFAHGDHPAGKILPVTVDGKEVKVSVPKDVRSGQILCFQGKGKYDGFSGRSGDLYITLHIEEAPPRAKRSGKLLIGIAVAAVVLIALMIVLLIPKGGGPSDAQAAYQEKVPAATQPRATQPPATQPRATQPPATQHSHSWTEATCETPETCSGCGDTRGKALGHQWLDATYDAPETCVRCGATRGESVGYPIAWCSVLEDSNNPNAKNSKDVSDGTWTDCFGKKHSNAVKFWVNASMVDSEYIVYDVSSGYSKLVLTMANEKGNASGGRNMFKVYADGKIIYQSDWISNDTPVIEQTLKIGNAKKIKIECITDSKMNCYGMMTGLLYK